MSEGLFDNLLAIGCFLLGVGTLVGNWVLPEAPDQWGYFISAGLIAYGLYRGDTEHARGVWHEARNSIPVLQDVPQEGDSESEGCDA